MILSGDQSRSNAVYRKLVNEAGGTVHALLSDYSAGGKNGGLRIYRFHPSKGKVEVITYDTTEESILETTKIVPDPAQHNFELNVKFKGV